MGDDRREAGPLAGTRNVGGPERLVSMILGGGLVAFALTRRRFAPKLLAIPGLMLLARGRSGKSMLYTMFDVSTVPAEQAEERPAAPVASAGQAAGEPGPESPHPAVPGTHRHPVPPNELGVPSVDVTPKLMREVAVPSAEGQGGPEGEGPGE